MDSLTGIIFERRRELEEEVENLYEPNLPYHNFGHIEDTLSFGQAICNACQDENIVVNREIVYLALLFHDAGYYENHKILGFKSKEDYSAELAKETLYHRHFSVSDIIQVVEAIMSTKKDGSFITTEQKAVRAADLLGMAGDYSQFVINSVNLKIEFELLNEQPISWGDWKKVSSDIVESYISKEIALTQFFRKCGDTSPFEEAARKNIRALLAEPIQPIASPNRY